MDIFCYFLFIQFLYIECKGYKENKFFIYFLSLFLFNIYYFKGYVLIKKKINFYNKLQKWTL